jgi:hypothetical protein
VTDTSEAISDSEGAEAWINLMKESIQAKDVQGLLKTKASMSAEGVTENIYQGITLAKWLDKAVAQVGKDK